MKKDKWYYDVLADEVINLRDCYSIWKYKSGEDYQIKFCYGDSTIHHTYKNEVERNNSFKHYIILVEAKELNGTQEPLTI